MIDKFNRTHRILDFPPGSFVMTREELPDGKLSPKYHGPFKVMSRSDNGSYTLLDITNQTLARNYSPEQLKRVTQALDATSSESYEVEAIVGHDFSGEGVEYTVKWKGYDSSHNERIPYNNFDSDLLIRQYWKRLKQNNPHVVAKQAKKREKAQKKALRQHKLQQKAIVKEASKSRRIRGRPAAEKQAGKL
ncbi:hypothetical protein BGX28_001924 [Mortierella sp. GBA30]|nr:hypothetical protein BGX28_001924 [Mortierella sp. GBA30]